MTDTTRTLAVALAADGLVAVVDWNGGITAVFVKGDPDADLFAAWSEGTIEPLNLGLPADHPARAAVLGGPDDG